MQRQLSKRKDSSLTQIPYLIGSEAAATTMIPLTAVRNDLRMNRQIDTESRTYTLNSSLEQAMTW